MATIERMHWLASCTDGFDLYTDHINLVFIFDPLSLAPELSQTSVRKVIRWAVSLSAYNYVCVHIPGESNLWADLLSRWHFKSTIRRLIAVPPLPSSSSPEFDWPSAKKIADIQSQPNRPSGLVYRESLWHDSSGRIWIPPTAEALQLRLCVIAHTSAAGHGGLSATLGPLSSKFVWDTIRADIRVFVKACIHFLSTTGGDRIPRPFGPAMHGTKPNDLVQFDYIDMGHGYSGDKCILMIRDEHSGYSWFYPSSSTAAEQAAHALLDWCAAFGPPSGFMSDSPTHFKNETLALLAKGLKVRHHFTLPYCPWSNGAVERLGKELLRVSRAVLSELQLDKSMWPDLVPLLQSALNNSPSPQRGNVAPITAFTGQQPATPITTFLRSDNATPLTLSDAQVEKSLNISSIVELAEQLHPMVQNSVMENRRRMRKSYENRRLPNFSDGDFVHVARHDMFKGEKLCLRWRGPRRDVKCLSDYVYQIEDLRNGSLSKAHGSRLKFYSDASLNQRAIMSHVISSETGMPVARLMQLVKKDAELFVQVRWKGLSNSMDTLEPLRQVYEDVPRMLENMLKRKATPVSLKTEAQAMLNL